MESFNLEYKFFGDTELLTDEIMEKLNSMRIPIYFNDCDCRHWIFDFDIDNVLFEATAVMPNCENFIIFNVTKNPFFNIKEY